MGFIWGVLALVSGIVSVIQIKSDAHLTSNSYAITGIIFGSLTLLIAFSLLNPTFLPVLGTYPPTALQR